MPEWLTSNLAEELSISSGQLVVRLVVSVAFGLAVAAVHFLSHGKQLENGQLENGDSIATTMVLLSVLVAMVTVVIGSSVARAFGLVGALSIVRFRTSIQDTRDTAFVVFAVTVGMAAGAGLFIVPLLGIPIVGIVAVGLGRLPRARSKGDGSCRVKVRIPVEAAGKIDVEGTLCLYLQRQNAVQSSISRQGASIDYTFTGLLRRDKSLVDLVAGLRTLDGIISVKVLRI